MLKKTNLTKPFFFCLKHLEKEVMKDGAKQHLRDNKTKEEYENREIGNWKLFFLVAKWIFELVVLVCQIELLDLFDD